MAYYNVIETRIKNKHDINENWESNDPILLDGEIVFVTGDNGEIQFKIGDGESTYTELPFLKFKDMEVTGESVVSTAPVRNSSLLVANTGFVHDSLRDAVNMRVDDGILDLSVIDESLLNKSMYYNLLGVAKVGDLILG